MTHTKEPWNIDKYENIYTPNGQLLLRGVVTPMTVGVNRATANDNARRIVACVNALAGVPTEWLESYTAGGVENVLQENARLREWIRRESEISDTCVFNVLGVICDGCKCSRKTKENSHE